MSKEGAMRTRGQLVIGSLILLAGVVLLLGNVFQIDFWAICWPLLLIIFGVWMLFRPRLTAPGPGLKIMPLGNIRRHGVWQLANEDILIFIGDVSLDLSQAEIPAGETRIGVYGFIGDVDLISPPDVGVAVSSMAFVTDSKLWGEKRDAFIAPVYRASEGYETAIHKVRLDCYFFILDIDVERVS